jgi:hypothetical protein
MFKNSISGPGKPTGPHQNLKKEKLNMELDILSGGLKLHLDA